MLLNNAPPCNDINSFKVYMTQIDSLKPQLKKIENLNLKMHEIRFKVKLYLGEEIYKSFEEYLDSIYLRETKNYPSKLEKLGESINSKKTDCQAVIQAQKNMLSIYSIGDKTLNKHSIFMSKLVKLMPDIQIKQWEN